MKVDSQIIYRKEPYGDVCTWEGDERHGTAAMSGYALARTLQSKRIPYNTVFKFGGLRLRVLGMVAGDAGSYCDSYYVKLDSPHSELYGLYRENAERFVRFFLRLEAAWRAFNGESVDGCVMPLTNRLAAKLL